jgi:hypothetical protein
MDTLLLDQSTWDVFTDAAGNWAVASPPYGLAQDVASACRTFLAECWYDDTLGVEYFQQILGKTPPVSYFQEQLVAAALTAAPTTGDVYVAKARCVVTSFDPATRLVKGQVQFVDNNGNPGLIDL